jgi:hypothetical protein
MRMMGVRGQASMKDIGPSITTAIDSAARLLTDAGRPPMATS